MVTQTAFPVVNKNIRLLISTYRLLCNDVFNIFSLGKMPACLGENDVVKENPLFLFL